MRTIKDAIDIFEVDGKYTKCVGGPQLSIEKHWVDCDRVVIVTPEGKRYTVIAKHLREAIANTTNWGPL